VVTVARHRLPIRVVVLATMVMTAAVGTAVAAAASHCGLDTGAGTGGGPLTTWLNPERVADQGHPSEPSHRLANPSGLLAGAG
jgi:hypothetical protein